MSQSFYIQVPQPPQFKAFLEGLNLPGLQCLGLTEWPDGPWQDGVLHFARKNLSACGVEVGYAEESLQVVISPLSSAEDFDLAFRFVEAFAAHAGAPVTREDGSVLPTAELRQHFGADWAAKFNDDFLQTKLEALKHGLHYAKNVRHYEEVDGCLRPFCLGPRLLAELKAAGPENELAARVVEAVRNLQWTEKYHYAEEIAVAAKGMDRPVAIALWEAGAAYLFPPVDLLVMKDKSAHPIHIPYGKLPDVAGPSCSYADEAQCFVEAVPDAEWPALLDRARAFQVSVEDQPAAPPAGPKWWQIWK